MSHKFKPNLAFKIYIFRIVSISLSRTSVSIHLIREFPFQQHQYHEKISNFQSSFLVHENQREITNGRQPATRVLFVQIWLPSFCIFGIHRRCSIDKLDFFLFHGKIFNLRFLHARKSERNHERKTTNDASSI